MDLFLRAGRERAEESKPPQSRKLFYPPQYGSPARAVFYFVNIEGLDIRRGLFICGITLFSRSALVSSRCKVESLHLRWVEPLDGIKV